MKVPISLIFLSFEDWVKGTRGDYGERGRGTKRVGATKGEEGKGVGITWQCY